jgi:hypothetical protein
VPFRRPLAVVGTLVIIFGVLLTGAVWLSSGTLPGDSLYGLKRASENVQLSLLNGDGARGKEYLTLAKRRTSEVAKLLSRSSSLAGAPGVHAAGGINSHTASLVTDTLDAADADIRNASRLLTGQAVHSSSHDPLRTLLSWTPEQVSRLKDITGRIPAGSLHDRAVGSQQLAERVLDRANRLDTNIGCSCLTETSSDDLGPLPCTVPCNPPASQSVPPLQAPVQTGATESPPGGASTAPSIPGSTVPGSGASASLPVIPGLPSPTGSPSLPTGAPTGSSGSTGTVTGSAPTSGPVVVDSCGLHIQLGEVGVGLGPCGLNLHL